MENFDMSKKIIELRKQKGFSQEELASRCKMNVRSIQRIESGKVKPRLYTLRVLSEVLEYQFQKSELNGQKFSWKHFSEIFLMKLSYLIMKIGGDKMNQNNILQNLSRSQKDRQIAGICGGFGTYTSIPSWFWRIMFIFFTFIYGTGTILYILFWIFMPKSSETTEENNLAQESWLHQFTRSNTDKKIAGICGGLGATTSLPSWCWRIIFVGSILIYGLGILMYVLLWIFAPSVSKKTKDLTLACSQ